MKNIVLLQGFHNESQNIIRSRFESIISKYGYNIVSPKICLTDGMHPKTILDLESHGITQADMVLVNTEIDLGSATILGMAHQYNHMNTFNNRIPIIGINVSEKPVNPFHRSMMNAVINLSDLDDFLRMNDFGLILKNIIQDIYDIHIVRIEYSEVAYKLLYSDKGIKIKRVIKNDLINDIKNNGAKYDSQVVDFIINKIINNENLL